MINTHMALATTQKGTASVAEYFGCMKSLADKMASAGKKMDDEELASYILVGLDIEFNHVVASVAMRVKPLSLGELYTQLIGFEQCMNLLHGGNSSWSTNLASYGGRGSGNGHGG